MLQCRRCGASIARVGDGLRVHGKHRHTTMNPSGEVFELRVFRFAPGARERGTPSLEYSWFPPLAWRFADCANCWVQLGWAFSGERSFFGLIADRLEESS